jgi:hypothetical protein
MFMARFEEPPFARGETFFGGDTIDISDLTNIGGEAYEGREYIVEDTLHQSGAHLVLRVVRNMSATAVLKKQTLIPSTVADYGHRRTIGPQTVAAALSYIADELLPAAGVPQYDLFYVVMEGPTKVTSPDGGSAITMLAPVVSAATGRVEVQDLTGATATLGGMVMNGLGRALEALTSGQTATDLLIYANIKW